MMRPRTAAHAATATSNAPSSAPANLLSPSISARITRRATSRSILLFDIRAPTTVSCAAALELLRPGIEKTPSSLDGAVNARRCLAPASPRDQAEPDAAETRSMPEPAPRVSRGPESRRGGGAGHGDGAGREG